MGPSAKGEDLCSHRAPADRRRHHQPRPHLLGDLSAAAWSSGRTQQSGEMMGKEARRMSDELSTKPRRQLCLACSLLSTPARRLCPNPSSAHQVRLVCVASAAFSMLNACCVHAAVPHPPAAGANCPLSYQELPPVASDYDSVASNVSTQQHSAAQCGTAWHRKFARNFHDYSKAIESVNEMGGRKIPRCRVACAETPW